jgi:hypothetical protein
MHFANTWCSLNQGEYLAISLLLAVAKTCANPYRSASRGMPPSLTSTFAQGDRLAGVHRVLQ